MLLAATALALAAGGAASAQSLTKEQTIAKNIATARKLAFPDQSAAFQRCDFDERGASVAGAVVAQVKSQFPPTKAFDQLYYIGGNSLGSWALTTSEGIILFDTMNNTDDAVKIIEPGMRQLGLDPAQIKYIVLMHGHGDHYGGASYFQDKYKARVLMQPLDWDVVANLPATRPDGRPMPPNPRRDMDIADGQKLTLGGSTVTMYHTPGHSPGTISALIPVTDRGHPHLVSFVGGTAFPRNADAAKQYLASFRRFTNLGWDAGADAMISNHPYVAGGHTAAYASMFRGPNDANPFVAGEDGYLRFMGAYEKCLTAQAMKSGYIE
jgi:metallo-beta-lactamase class B